MTTSTTNYLPLIVEKLKGLRPYKIVLFGSHAYGNPNPDSDIDLLVVLDKDDLPQSFAENMETKLLVRNMLFDINQHVPIDLIVQTKPMYEKFNDLGSLFAQEIARNGEVLYESTSPLP